jgi:hypothetical protein
MNEANASAIGGAPKGYEAAMYGRDVAAFRGFAREAVPAGETVDYAAAGGCAGEVRLLSVANGGKRREMARAVTPPVQPAPFPSRHPAR